MSTKQIRFYYVDRSLKLVFIYSDEQTTHLEFLGSTDNPFPKMAAAAFLHNEAGHRIIDYTK